MAHLTVKIKLIRKQYTEPRHYDCIFKEVKNLQFSENMQDGLSMSAIQFTKKKTGPGIRGGPAILIRVVNTALK
jgi:hypothetical protein